MTGVAVQQVFRNALVRHEPIIYGIRLRPFCAGHAYILLAADSPYLTGADRRLSDLAFALQVCSRSFEDGSSWVSSAGVERDCAVFGRSLGPRKFREQNGLFEAYLQDALAMPLREASGDAAAPKHPWPILVAVNIMERVGESRAWNMPLPMAITIHSAIGELRGDTSLWSDDDLQCFEAAKRMRA